jgi:hypothetical protein
MKRTPKIRVDYTDWTEEQHVEHLRTQPQYQAYLEKFDAKSVESFITDYAGQKHKSLSKLEYYREDYENYEIQFLSEAERYIDFILQKKLFNLQCQWRAEQIKLPLVNTCHDFKYWERHIRSCPFIPPVTQEEMEVCIRFLQEELDYFSINNYDDCGWQNYNEFKNQAITDENDERSENGYPLLELHENPICEELPELYDFFDAHFGTRQLIFLPDLRYKKDRMYRKAGMSVANKKWEAEKSLNPELTQVAQVYKSGIYAYAYYLNDFVAQTEDESAKEAYKYYQHYYNKGDNEGLNEQIETDLEFLKNCSEVVPMVANDDWRASVVESVKLYKQKKATEMMPYVYETYRMEFDEDESVERIIANRVARYKFDEEDSIYEHITLINNYVLDGRETLDGVRDFNY